MTVDNSPLEQATERPVQLPPVDPTAAALATVQRQLAEQTSLLRTLHQELAALRAAQATYSDTVVKLERQLRWARWMRRIRTTLFTLFWLGDSVCVSGSKSAFNCILFLSDPKLDVGLPARSAAKRVRRARSHPEWRRERVH